jgi:8-oxo-dGTP pyrophosphatase MutT (NUDIX family)
MSPYYQHLRKAVGHRLLLIPSVAAVIHDEDGRLLLQQKHDGSWSLPAGAIEPGESPGQAVVREVLEETGIEVVDFHLLAVLGGGAYRHAYANGDQVEYTIVLFKCVAGAFGTFTDVGETKAVRYFAREEMPDLTLPYDFDLLFARGGGK